METWQEVCILLSKNETNLEEAKQIISQKFDSSAVYTESINFAAGSFFFLAICNGEKKLVIYPESEVYLQFNGSEVSCAKSKAKLCAINVDNCKILRKTFPYTNPSSHKDFDITVGLGDRLGLASPGHIRLLKGKKVFPVLAQQSIRELNLTGRTYDDVLTAASWAVFQEGYLSGFGADGDHLKTPAEVKMAIDCGFTMITLDCSEQINNNINHLPPSEIDELYAAVPAGERERLEMKYLGKKFTLQKGLCIRFSLPDLKKTVLIYLQAIKYTINIYHQTIKTASRRIDFEISIDETLTSTTPESHYLVASELLESGVDITSLAPRFCGEFQKGTDYKGDIESFTGEFEAHVKIAEHFGYKISIHSGSDKFSVFPIIGAKTGGRYHLKTAGTNWLEAVRIIALQSPSLYRKMHQYALDNLAEAKKYYHISADIANIPVLEKLADHELPNLMDMNDSRQLLHITYGLILSAKSPDGSAVFKDEIYALLNKYENEYYEALQRHIGRHLERLGV